MLKRYKDLLGHPLHAVDGQIGKIDQLIFDETNWAIRYIVVDVGSFLAPRRVLLSPAGVDRVEHHGIWILATKEQIRKSPEIDTAMPLSREHEIILHDYYSWPYYWLFPSYYNSLGTAIYPGSDLTLQMEAQRERGKALKEKEEDKESEKIHVFSMEQLLGCAVNAPDETAGEVNDLLIDIKEWVTRYMVVDTGGILSKKSVLLSVQWTKAIDWEAGIIYIEHEKSVIQHGPTYDPKMEIDRDYEQRLFQYYEKPPYWLV